MSLSVTIIAAILVGFVVGVSISIIYMFFKTWLQNKRALKKNPNIVEEIKLNKKENLKIQNERIKKIKEIQERNRRRDGGKPRRDGGGSGGYRAATRREPVDEKTAPNIEHKKPSPKRNRVQIPAPDFTLRD